MHSNRWHKQSNLLSQWHVPEEDFIRTSPDAPVRVWRYSAHPFRKQYVSFGQPAGIDIVATKNPFPTHVGKPKQIKAYQCHTGTCGRH
jgi:hypothetical protein